MNGKVSKLIRKYCVALASNQESKGNNYETRLENIVKKAWNNTPSKERGKLRKRMERIIVEHNKQLEKSNGERGS